MSDSLVYELASTSDVEEKPFVHRDWLYCNDSNQGLTLQVKSSYPQKHCPIQVNLLITPRDI